jgi:hypothetical protein
MKSQRNYSDVFVFPPVSARAFIKKSVTKQENRYFPPFYSTAKKGTVRRRRDLDYIRRVSEGNSLLTPSFNLPLPPLHTNTQFQTPRMLGVGIFFLILSVCLLMHVISLCALFLSPMKSSFYFYIIFNCFSFRIRAGAFKAGERDSEQNILQS